jgi:hypothetical protein
MCGRLVRVFAIDLVPELVRAGRARGSGALSPRNCRAAGSLTTGVPKSSLKETREAVSDRGGGVRGRGEAARKGRRQGKEPRS